MSQQTVEASASTSGGSLTERLNEFREIGEHHRALPWAWRAACRNHPRPELYAYPGEATEDEFEQMTNACKTCPVRRQCAEFAVESEATHQFYAGHTADTLRRLRDEGSRSWRTIVR